MDRTVNTSLMFICCFASLICKIAASCESDNADLGETECVLLTPYYSEYQWGTCVEETYLKLSTGGRHFCKGHSVVCYNQCMLEQHDLDHGPVYNDCRCSPHGLNLTISTQQPDISTWCFSPNGENCLFYRDCLERRYPCRDVGNSYAIDFGERFCNLYGEHASNFTEQGQEWINAVRKCLQVKLVPLLRTYKQPSCEEIEETAFNSHADCYVNPYPGKPSICDLSFHDWFQVVATVSPSLEVMTLNEDAWRQNDRITHEGLDVFKNCYHRIVNTIKNFIKLKIQLLWERTNTKLLDISDEVGHFIRDVVRSRYNIDDLIIYPINGEIENNFGRGENSIVDILIAPRRDFNLNYDGESEVDVNGVADYFLEQVASGNFYPQFSSGASVLEYTLCQDIECQDKNITIQQPTEPLTTTIGGLGVLHDTLCKETECPDINITHQHERLTTISVARHNFANTCTSKLLSILFVYSLTLFFVNLSN